MMSTTKTNSKINSFSERVYTFFSTLQFPIDTPQGVQVLNPYQNPQTLKLCKVFWERYYVANNPRVSVWGINPGRLGGGLTGIPFTDPIILHNVLNLPHPKEAVPELSAQFINKVIARYGGHQKFYSSLYLTGLCPLGFIKEGKNYNFYDEPLFAKSLEPFFETTVSQQISWGLRRDVAVCLGKGKLFALFQKLNEKYYWFEKLYPLDHPRFIMQYRRSKVEEYIEEYNRLFTSIVEN